MTEDELKVLLVLSQKQPSKLTQEHLNLINDALEQAHGNKHMQDRGLQLSVKAVLGYPLETEHYTTIQSYVQQCQAKLRAYGWQGCWCDASIFSKNAKEQRKPYRKPSKPARSKPSNKSNNRAKPR
ncbi:hypothetical protein NHP194003_16160 [Helicobacter suis]|nr:hypothetical protein NHP194003_16160 [Helicobacter suis]